MKNLGRFGIGSVFFLVGAFYHWLSAGIFGNHITSDGEFISSKSQVISAVVYLFISGILFFIEMHKQHKRIIAEKEKIEKEKEKIKKDLAYEKAKVNLANKKAKDTLAIEKVKDALKDMFIEFGIPNTEKEIEEAKKALANEKAKRALEDLFDELDKTK